MSLEMDSPATGDRPYTLLNARGVADGMYGRGRNPPRGSQALRRCYDHGYTVGAARRQLRALKRRGDRP
jgi:hypothetical protein